jgi:hypothetical protein
LTGSNTYTGATRISGGVLSVNSLADGGVASALGASVAAAPALVFDGGTLQYTGGAQSTNRTFTPHAQRRHDRRLRQRAADLQQPRAGRRRQPLAGSGARALTLTGTTADNAFAGQIVNGHRRRRHAVNKTARPVDPDPHEQTPTAVNTTVTPRHASSERAGRATTSPRQP